MREKKPKKISFEKTGKLTNDLKQHEPQYLIVNILLWIVNWVFTVAWQ